MIERLSRIKLCEVAAWPPAKIEALARLCAKSGLPFASTVLERLAMQKRGGANVH